MPWVKGLKNEYVLNNGMACEIAVVGIALRHVKLHMTDESSIPPKITVNNPETLFRKFFTRNLYE